MHLLIEIGRVGRSVACFAFCLFLFDTNTTTTIIPGLGTTDHTTHMHTTFKVAVVHCCTYPLTHPHEMK